MSSAPKPPDDLAAARVKRTAERDGRHLTGSQFILDAPDQVPAVWGDGNRVLMAHGESLLIVGPAGVGKTTLAQQLTLARHGIGRQDLLGFPVQIDPGAVLYIAADRPSQAARSFARMVTAEDRPALDRLAIHRGPLPFDLTTSPGALADYAESRGAGTIVIDSLKDVALDLAKDETGSRVNQALQECLVRGVQVIAIHHQRKATGDNRAPRHLSDVYGSTWLTAGAGSVLLLWGEPGGPVVTLHHLKQPADEIGPLELLHDHDRGATTIRDEHDLAAVAHAAPAGLSAPDAARTVYETSQPTKSQIEKARRRLEDLVTSGALGRIPGQAPNPVLYTAPQQRGSRG